MSARFLFVGLLTLLCARAETIPVMWAEFATYGGATGHKDGLSTVAKFNNPSSVARDSGGNLYIADTGNHVIRKIDPTGTVSTLAGTPLQSGNTDGTGANARFNSPSDIEIAPDGTLYVADKGNLLIRTVSPTGVVTTFAGAKSGSNFFISDGVYDKLSVRFQQPTGLALGSDGSVYVADNTAIRVVRPNGTATTFVTSIEQPFDVEIDPTAGLVVSTAGNTGLFRVNDAGIVSPLSANLSSVISGFATIAHAAVADDGTVYAADQLFNRLLRISAQGTVSIWAGNGSEARDSDGQSVAIQRLDGVAIGAAGSVLITDSSNGVIRSVSSNQTISLVAGVAPTGMSDGHIGTAGLWAPRFIAATPSGNLAFIDNGPTRWIDGDTLTISTPGGVPAVEDYSFSLFPYVQDILPDEQGGAYLSNFPRGQISYIDAAGALTTIAGIKDQLSYAPGPVATATLGNIDGIARDAEGNLFVCEQSTDVIIKISPGGTVSTYAGTGTYGSADGTLSTATFANPQRLAFDASGNLWIAEDSRIRKITTSGEVVTVAGGSSSETPADGVGSAASFFAIADFAIAPDGNLFVTERVLPRVRRVSPTGSVDTLDITGLFGAKQPGRSFVREPDGITVDRNGVLYVCDPYGGVILAGIPIPANGNLSNLSVLKHINEDEILTVGFVLEGDSPKPTLVRAVGPTLAEYGVTSGFLFDPQFEFYPSGGTRLATSDDWASNNAITDAFQHVGAFGLPSGSKDAASLQTLGAGSYTAQVRSKAGDGLVLVEAYDAEIGNGSKLKNLSTLTRAGSGDNRLIAGFVIEGNAPKTLLIRGIGPALTQFGLPADAVLANPQLTLFRGSSAIATNDDWAGHPLLGAAAALTGAFPLADATTRDAAIITTLAPGPYTAHLDSAANQSGQAIIEVYEVE